MATKNLSETLRLHGMWLRGEFGGVRACLSNVDLRGAYLSSINLCSAYLDGANLSKAYLHCSQFRGADLSRANLRDAYLADANLCRAMLYNADLTDANLHCADLRDAILHGAILNGTNLCGAIGNMREVRSAQIDRLPCVWTTAPNGIVTLRIGWHAYTLETWRNADAEWLAAVNSELPDWWNRYGAVILALVDSAPAKPWGTPESAKTPVAA